MARGKVVGVELIDACFRNGRRISGMTIAKLDNGKEVYLGDDSVKGFDAAYDLADQMGYDTTQVRAQSAKWVKTGTWEAVTI